MERANVNRKGDFANGYRYAFDESEIDPANRELLRSGQVVALRGKVFDVLLALATHPGRLLAKQEIIEQVWQNEFVEEGNLARSVSTLRNALDDTAAGLSWSPDGSRVAVVRQDIRYDAVLIQAY